ncbi:MAG: hypothetical protein WD276_05965 [Actinomycetota bacterium]
MDDQSVLLLALGMLFVAGITLSVCGWVLFVRSRRTSEPAKESEK